MIVQVKYELSKSCVVSEEALAQNWSLDQGEHPRPCVVKKVRHAGTA